MQKEYKFNFPVEQEESSISIWPKMYGSKIIYWYYTITTNGIDSTSNKLCETPDMAYLLALEEKYLGINEKFAGYVAKILGIQSEWANVGDRK